MAEVELELPKAIAQRTWRYLAAFLIDHRTSHGTLRPAGTKRSARGAKTRVRGRNDFFVRHAHQMGAHGIGASAIIWTMALASERSRQDGSGAPPLAVAGRSIT